MFRSGPVMSNAAITAIGAYLPSRVLGNDHLERMVETSDEWIVQRTGIRERRIAADDEFCSDLAIAAVRDLALRHRLASLADVDYILTATSTPDTVFPSVSARVQAAFDIPAAGALDLQAACAGFVSALQMANALILSGLHRKILVIGAETLSKVTDYTDRTTCILFGDGAAAVLVEAVAPGETGAFLGSSVATQGESGHHLYRSALSPVIGGHPIRMNDRIVQNGREVFKWAVSQVSEGVTDLLAACGLAAADVAWFVPHSANIRIVQAICERTNIPLASALTSIETCGNTSAASIPLALYAALRDNKLHAGDLLLLYGFGGGLTQAGLLLEWRLAA